jgi:hypothetical protein
LTQALAHTAQCGGEMGRTDPATTVAPGDCCGSKAWEYLVAADGYRLGRCRSCGLHYVGNRPSTVRRLEELDQGIFGEGRHLTVSGSDGRSR